MDDLIADFVAECREMLEALGGEIVAWEASPDDRARLDNIFRFVHTVKGNCGFFEFPRLEALSHAAEDALADCRAGRRQPDPALVSAVLAVLDRISDMIAAIEHGKHRAHQCRIGLTAAGAAIGERVLCCMTQRLEAREFKESAIAFHRMDEAEDVIEPRAIIGTCLPRDNLAAQRFKHFPALGHEIGNQVVHQRLGPTQERCGFLYGAKELTPR